METKEKTIYRITRNILTSLLGVVFMAIAGFAAYKWFIVGAMPMSLTNIGLIAALAAIGYIFLMAKDSLITGLTFGLYKPESKAQGKLKSKGIDPPPKP